MSKIILIVKSQTFHDVKLAARERGIYVTDLAISHTSQYNFHARTDESNLLAVQKWFLEEETITDGFGYPVGTLLFYRLPD